jgi:hypothetical protein
MENIVWSYNVRNEEGLERVKGEGKIVHIHDKYNEGRLTGSHVPCIGTAF